MYLKLTNLFLTSVNVLFVNCRINAVFPILLSPTTTTDTFKLFSILNFTKIQVIKQLSFVLNYNLTDLHILVIKLHIIKVSSLFETYITKRMFRYYFKSLFTEVMTTKLKPLLQIDN